MTQIVQVFRSQQRAMAIPRQEIPRGFPITAMRWVRERGERAATRQPQPLFSAGRDDTLYIPNGALWELSRLRVQEGGEPLIQIREVKLANLKSDLGGQFARQNPGVIRAIELARNGIQVNYAPSRRSLAEVVRGILEAFPAARTTVITATTLDRDWLVSLTRDVAGAPQRIQINLANRIDPHHLYWSDLLLLCDPLTAIGGIAATVIDTAPRSRVVALLDSTRIVSAFDRQLLDLAYSKMRVSVDGAPQPVLMALEVHRYNHSGRHDEESPLAVKRRRIWGCRERNEAIIAAATQLSVSSNRTGAQQAVGPIVIVENIDHAAALLRLRPSWRIAFSGSVAALRMSADDRQQLIRQRISRYSEPGESIVVTMEAARSLRWPEQCAVVIAHGLPAPLPGWPQIGAGRSRMRIIDIADHGHPLLRRYWRLRSAAYASLPLVGSEP